jgi:hypothetical protein
MIASIVSSEGVNGVGLPLQYPNRPSATP